MFGVVVSAILLSTITAPAVTREIATTESPVNCTSGGYTKLSTGNYYKVHDTRKWWNDASSTCASEGAYLVVLNNEAEARAVTDHTFTTIFGLVWVGIRDMYSVHGQPVDQIYHRWAATRSRYHMEACIALNFNGFLDDMECDYGLAFVCEKTCPN